MPTVEALLLRDKLQARRAQLKPHRCPQLQEQYALVRSQVGGGGEAVMCQCVVCYCVHCCHTGS